jgi:hypothetical protein
MEELPEFTYSPPLDDWRCIICEQEVAKHKVLHHLLVCCIVGLYEEDGDIQHHFCISTSTGARQITGVTDSQLSFVFTFSKPAHSLLFFFFSPSNFINPFNISVPTLS